MKIESWPIDQYERADAMWIVEALTTGGDRDAVIARMLGKILRQRIALDVLNRKVVSQRFRLRTLNEMGRDLTRDEYLAARAAVVNEQLKDRIDAEPAAV